MSNFNLENYETVKERKKRFYKDYPDGSLITELIHFEKNHVIIKGIVYRTKEEQEKQLPTGTGYAEEFQGQGGFTNKFAWMENCDESAIGRSLDQAGYSGGKCSQEEMKKVENSDKIKQQLIEKLKKYPSTKLTEKQQIFIVNAEFHSIAELQKAVDKLEAKNV